MAKLKTRTNQPVNGADVLDYIEQNGSTTELGGNLDVDGVLKASGGEEVITDIQAIIDEGNPELSLKQGNTIVGMVDINPLLQNGEKMEGYSVTKYTETGYDLKYVYCGVVKNGNKLTFCTAFKITRISDTASSNPSIIRYVLPTSIADKLYPVTIGTYDLLDTKIINAYDTPTSSIKAQTWFSKSTNTCVLSLRGFNGVSVLNTEYYIRHEVTFLLSDNLAG